MRKKGVFVLTKRPHSAGRPRSCAEDVSIKGLVCIPVMGPGIAVLGKTGVKKSFPFPDPSPGFTL